MSDFPAGWVSSRWCRNCGKLVGTETHRRSRNVECQRSERFESSLHQPSAKVETVNLAGHATIRFVGSGTLQSVPYRDADWEAAPGEPVDTARLEADEEIARRSAAMIEGVSHWGDIPNGEEPT